MSSVDPSWPPPARAAGASGRTRWRTSSPFVLPHPPVAFLAAPLGVAWAVRSGLTAQAVHPVFPACRAPAQGKAVAGARRPLLPERGQWRLRRGQVPDRGQLGPEHPDSPRHHRDQRPGPSSSSSRFFVDLALPIDRGAGRTDSRRSRPSEGFADVEITPAAADRRRAATSRSPSTMAASPGDITAARGAPLADARTRSGQRPASRRARRGGSPPTTTPPTPP